MKRMRVIAGPNGSGKTTLVNEKLSKWRMLYGFDLIDFNRHINPDDLDSVDKLDFSEFGLTVDESDFRNFMLQSRFYKECNIDLEDLKITNNCFNLPKNNIYISSVLSDFMRERYVLSEKRLFSFETVLSHSSKVDFLKRANDNGWQIYLYYVCTIDPLINCERVKYRVSKGGHDVPPDVIKVRYAQSLRNLYPTLKLCRRAYFFDNSKDMDLVADKDPHGRLKFYGNTIPTWLYSTILKSKSFLLLDNDQG